MGQSDETIKYAVRLSEQAVTARSLVRDLDPKNDLRYLRLRAKRHEVLVAVDDEFIVIVIQRWTPAG